VHQLQILYRDVSDVVFGHRQAGMAHRLLKISDIAAILDVCFSEFPSEGMEEVIYVRLINANLSKDILQVSVSVSISKRRSCGRTEEEWRIKLTISIVSHISV
jgi:hypothetical protein